MLAQLSSSDGAPSEAGAELQKLAEEHTLCLGPETHTAEALNNQLLIMVPEPGDVSL